MKPLSILAICALALFSCSKENPTPTVQTLLIPLENADMESGDTKPYFWFSNAGSPEIATTWTTDQSNSSSHSLEISRATVSDTNSFGYWGGVIQGAIPTGKNLTLSVKIKGDNLVGQGIAIAIRVDGANTSNPQLQFSTTQGMQVINGTFDWKSYSIELTNISIQAKYVYLFLIYGANTTGKVYFDDVSLTYN
jgi:hypothetical protein